MVTAMAGRAGRVIYIAGPYRSPTENGLFQNIMRAREAARKLWLAGWVVICPHMNTAFMGGDDIDDWAFLEGDLEILRRCDAVYMLEGWESSQGARLEHEEAIKCGKQILYEGKL